MTLQSGCPVCGAGQVKREIVISHDCGLKISVTAEVEVWQLPGERLDGNGSYLHAVSFEPVPPAADAPRGPTWEEIRHGTPDTPERIETIHRADEILRVIQPKGGGVEVRFNVAGLEQLSTGERDRLAKRLDAPIPSPAPTPACTGVSASWCPIHGECSCERGDGERYEMLNPGCPLHGDRGDHPRAPTSAPSGDDVPGEWPDSENHGEPAAPAPSEALLPCPFCGAPPVVVMPEENYGGPECHTPNCPASPLTTGDWLDTRAAHFAVWNRRVAPREPTEEAVARALEDIWRTGDPTAYRLQSAIDTVGTVKAARDRAKGSR